MFAEPDVACLMRLDATISRIVQLLMTNIFLATNSPSFASDLEKFFFASIDIWSCKCMCFFQPVLLNMHILNNVLREAEL